MWLCFLFPTLGRSQNTLASGHAVQYLRNYKHRDVMRSVRESSACLRIVTEGPAICRNLVQSASYHADAKQSIMISRSKVEKKSTAGTLTRMKQYMGNVKESKYLRKASLSIDANS